MTETNNVKRYNEMDKKCEQLVASVEPFLKEFSKAHDCGTCFYDDITVLAGPSASEYNYFQNNRPELLKDWQRGLVSIYNIKWAGVAFVIEYKNFFIDEQGRLLPRPIRKPVNAFMVYNHNEYHVPFTLANEVKDLYAAQEYRNAIYGAHRTEIERAMAAQNVARSSR